MNCFKESRSSSNTHSTLEGCDDMNSYSFIRALSRYSSVMLPMSQAQMQSSTISLDKNVMFETHEVGREPLVEHEVRNYIHIFENENDSEESEKKK